MESLDDLTIDTSMDGAADTQSEDALDTVQENALPANEDAWQDQATEVMWDENATTPYL